MSNELTPNNPSLTQTPPDQNADEIPSENESKPINNPSEDEGIPINPSLTQTPRHQIADVIPLEYETSILNWLERSGRLIDRTNAEEDTVDPEEEIAELIENDSKYDDDDDDDVMDDD